MNSRKNWLILFGLNLFLVSCGSITIKNSEVCGDAGPLGASCFNTLNDESRDIPPKQWDQERIGMLCTRSSNFADWMKALQKLCYSSKKCTYDSKKRIVKFQEEIKTFEEIVGSDDLNAQIQNIDLLQSTNFFDSEFMRQELINLEEEHENSL